jgi:DNA-binding transcriptional ArsR family regulator
METRRDVFQAIADPTRRTIIMLLAAGSLTPNAIAGHFDSSRQAISKHLQILNECEIIKSQQQGREIHYHLNAGKMNEVENWLTQFRELLANKFAQLDEILEHLKTKK